MTQAKPTPGPIKRNIVFKVGNKSYQIFESQLSSDGQSVSFKYNDDNGVMFEGYSMGNSDTELKQTAFDEIMYRNKPGWCVDKLNFGNKVESYHVSENGKSICVVTTANGKEIERAALIAEAGTVYHETQLTPRQLLEQRNMFIAELNKLADEYESGGGLFLEARFLIASDLRGLIAKIKGVK